MRIRVHREKSGRVHSFKFPPIEEGAEAMNVHVMEAGQNHREQTTHALQIVLITGEINVNGTVLKKRGQYVIVPRRNLLSVDTHKPSAYTVQKVHHREGTDYG